MTREFDKQVTKSPKALRETMEQLVILNKEILKISNNIELLTTRCVQDKYSKPEEGR